MKGTLRRSCRFSNWPGPSELSVTLNPRNENLEKQIGSTSLVPNQLHSHRVRPLKTLVENLNRPGFLFPSAECLSPSVCFVFPLFVSKWLNDWASDRLLMEEWCYSALFTPQPSSLDRVTE